MRLSSVHQHAAKPVRETIPTKLLWKTQGNDTRSALSPQWPTFISFWSRVLDKCRKFGKYIHSSSIGLWMLWWEFQVPEKQQGADLQHI